MRCRVKSKINFSAELNIPLTSATEKKNKIVYTPLNLLASCYLYVSQTLSNFIHHGWNLACGGPLCSVIAERELKMIQNLIHNWVRLGNNKKMTESILEDLEFEFDLDLT